MPYDGMDRSRDLSPPFLEKIIQFLAAFNENGGVEANKKALST